MKVVALVSGGLDSTVMSLLLKKDGFEILPIFIDYGQRARTREWQACRKLLKIKSLPAPKKLDFQSLGKNIKSGLTDKNLDVFADAFLPGRNLYFLLLAASIAVQKQADAVAIGLLSEANSQFPDQTQSFLAQAESTLSLTMGRQIKIIAPLIDLEKRDVVRLGKNLRISGTYSCHFGSKRPCGKCIACREYN